MRSREEEKVSKGNTCMEFVEKKGNCKVKLLHLLYGNVFGMLEFP